MTDSYDFDTVTQYVEHGGTHCPECNTEMDNLIAGRLQDDGDGAVTRHYRCTHCKATWLERYILDDCVPERHGNHHNQQQLFASTG